MHEMSTPTPAAAGKMPADGSSSEATTRYLPLCDIHASDAELVITSLRRARIASYVGDPVTSTDSGNENAITAGLFVDADEMNDSRAIVNALGIELPTHACITTSTPAQSMDVHGQFADLTSDWNVDTAAAIRAAEKDIRDENAQRQAQQESELAGEYELDADSADTRAEELVEHYVAPTPPPLPRPAAPTLRALLVIALGIAVLIFGGLLDFDPDFTLLLGVGTLLTGVGLLVMRLRPHHDGDFGGDCSDDGAVL